MTLVLDFLRRVFKLALYGILFILMVALSWTLLQVIAIATVDAPYSSTTEARQGAYRATATAINTENEGSSLRAEPRFVLMQDSVNVETSVPAPMSAAADRIAATEVPDDFRLPELLVPLGPAEGKWHAGMLVPTRVPPVVREHRLINIMLLGSDEELTEDNFIRTDTMIIVSLNVETGTVAMMSLPRDLFVYIPHGKMGRLNTAFGIGANIGWDPGGGFGLLRQTLFYNFGINVHYYARVNFSGFEATIDKLGGVEISVDCAYRDLYPTASGGYRWRTLPVGYYTFDGFDALWYARTRKYTDDFDRGRRQQQLLRAMWRKARGQGLISTLPRLWGELVEVVDTDIPFELMLRLLPSVVNLELGNIENFTLKKNYHTTEWVMPGGAEVQLPNAEEIAVLMQDFYLPPSSNQLAISGPSIGVYNASGHENWDIVASEQLRWQGYNSVALGLLDAGQINSSSQLTDYVATEKGSLVPKILRALNMNEEQVEREANADRDYDYVAIIGRDYKSCTYAVLPLDG